MSSLLSNALDALDCEGEKLRLIEVVLKFWAQTDSPLNRDALKSVADMGCVRAPNIANRYWRSLTDEQRTKAGTDVSNAILRLGTMARSACQGDDRRLDPGVLEHVASALVVGADAERNRFQYPLM